LVTGIRFNCPERSPERNMTEAAPRLRPAMIRPDGRGGAQITIAQDGATAAGALDREALWALAMQEHGVLDESEPTRRRANGA